MKTLTIDELIIINQYSQGIVEKSRLLDWYKSLKLEDQQSIIPQIWSLALQAKAREEDVAPAVEKAQLKLSNNPVVMLKSAKEPFSNRGYNLAKLKDKVLVQAFMLIIECFVVADKRKKTTDCANGCEHWWHQDLSDDQIIKSVRYKYSNGIL
ncbi:MAG TPA: DUF5958 family protein [bacterium]|nr:DUF5958 family protein [bacterium]